MKSHAANRGHANFEHATTETAAACYERKPEGSAAAICDDLHHFKRNAACVAGMPVSVVPPMRDVLSSNQQQS
jgi:hypothetical protein